MKQKDNVRPIERKVRQAFYRDGLLEIMVGVYLPVIGVMIQGGTGGLSALAIFVLVPVWRATKRRYVYPRIGYVNLEHEAESQAEAKGILRFLVVYLALLAVLALAFNWIWGPEQGREFFYLRFLPVVVGLMLAIGPVAAAEKSQLKHWYAIAGWFAAVGVGVIFLGLEDFHSVLAVQLAVSGAVPLAAGVVLFVRFLRKNPVIEEAGDGQG